MPPSLILASGSASRAALLTGAGISFTKIPADLDEDAIKDDGLARGMSPKAIALKLAEAKALHVSARNPGLVLGGDQVLQLEKDLISKSHTMDDARDLLKRMSGKTHYLHGGLALAEGGHIVWSTVESAEMHVRRLSDDYIDGYLERAGDKILSSVGCYQLEGEGVHLFEAIRGDYFTVLGLSLFPLLAQLRHMRIVPA
ncbi:septum formation protein Maf [Asticcacaulis sp. AC460]|uniref:Maf family protein n=1 Tax=Asticcacaulis sp. AC460 TaxID=1282360 RepID=UPI0003C3E974|nr:Maf family protein [Asticcacaulis sp. AC460]ESQ90544.1 septum formation protein Maf [Asticcacaulis sp. AC460]